MIIERVCFDCKKIIKIEVEQKAFEKWLNGMHIQDAMPTLTADERELLISGICGPCFDEIFPDE